jgi:hypothetical protein
LIKIFLFDFSDKTIKEKRFENSVVPTNILSDDNLLIFWISKQIFPDYTILDHQKYRNKKGDPDLKLLNLNNGDQISMEFKQMGSYGLSYEQLKFMFENKKSYVLFYSIDNFSDGEFSQIN